MERHDARGAPSPLLSIPPTSRVVTRYPSPALALTSTAVPRPSAAFLSAAWRQSAPAEQAGAVKWGGVRNLSSHGIQTGDVDCVDTGAASEKGADEAGAATWTCCSSPQWGQQSDRHCAEVVFISDTSAEGNFVDWCEPGG
jgi:hypothetical protein